jgi:hypothetical protein
MTFDWNEYLALAKRLALVKSNEAALRSAISRAYCCVYNVALQRAKDNEFRVKDDAGSSGGDYAISSIGSHFGVNGKIAAFGVQALFDGHMATPSGVPSQQ